MSTSIKPNETRTLEVRDISTDKINLSFYCVHTTVNTPFSGQVINPLYVNIELYLKRPSATDKMIPIYNGVFAPVAVDSAKDSSLFPYAKGSQYRIILAAGGSVKEQIVIPMCIKLHEPITLAKDDVLFCKIYFQSAACAATVDTATSYLLASAMETFNIERFTPRMDVVSITSGQQNLSMSAPPNLCELTFVNLDKTSILSTDAAIVSYNAGDDSGVYQDLLGRRAGMFDNNDNDAIMYQTFPIIPPSFPKKRCQFTINMNPTNITASNNYVVMRWVFADQRLASVNQSRKSEMVQGLIQ